MKVLFPTAANATDGRFVMAATMLAIIWVLFLSSYCVDVSSAFTTKTMQIAYTSTTMTGRGTKNNNYGLTSTQYPDISAFLGSAASALQASVEKSADNNADDDFYGSDNIPALYFAEEQATSSEYVVEHVGNNTVDEDYAAIVMTTQQQPAAFLNENENGENENDIYKTAIRRTLFWVGTAIGFGIFLLFTAGPKTSSEFYAGYLLEQSLSVDNLLVFLLLFDYFKVPKECQNRVLNWGIIGSIVMRATMIGAGAVALHKFNEILLVFAGIMIFSSAKVILGGEGGGGEADGEEEDEEENLSENAIIQFSKNIIGSTDKFDGDRFFTEIDGGVRKATPLFLCMIAVEISDVVFAVDSIPAIFGITKDPLVVFSSNMFAIMGLRSLYTILSKAASELKYLDKAVAVVLGFIGVKLIAEYFGYAVFSTSLSLGVVVTILGAGVFASLTGRSIVENKKNLETKKKKKPTKLNE